jgi:nucleotide-binding universal stress UspA family protein
MLAQVISAVFVIRLPFLARPDGCSRKKRPVFRNTGRATRLSVRQVYSMRTTTSLKKFSRRSSTSLRTDRAIRKPVQISNVLIPIDFSPPSLEAIEFALPLIKKFGAHLHLVHVFESDYPLASMAAMPLIVPELEVGRRVRSHLKDVARKYSIDLNAKNIHALEGRPFQQICDLARKIDIDLIVASTRGKTGLKHLALGSTAERIVRYSPCPVLVVRGPDQEKKDGRDGKHPRPALVFRKILVPIDFSACSMKGLDYAKALAKQFGSTLVLLHSVHLEYYVASDEYARYDLPMLMQQVEKTAKKQMRDLVQKTDWEGIKVETSLEVGHAGEQICDRAQDRHADLIVTSTHGTTGLKHILLGSTAEYVIRHAHCPVLVVPSRERPALPLTKTQT